MIYSLFYVPVLPRGQNFDITSQDQYYNVTQKAQC